MLLVVMLVMMKMMPRYASLGRRRRRAPILEEQASDPLAPHLDESAGCQRIDGVPEFFDARQRVLPDRPLAPGFALLPTFVGGAH